METLFFASGPIIQVSYLLSPSPSPKSQTDCRTGVWLFHCHIQWHFISGLIATFIEAPDALIESGLKIPEDHLEVCRGQGLPTIGNAAAKTDDLFDLDGEPKPPAPLPDGFTARGIVALVFSIIAAFIGLAAIVWYGAGDIGKQEPTGEVAKVIQKSGNE